MVGHQVLDRHVDSHVTSKLTAINQNLARKLGNHASSGNLLRFEQGSIQLRLDEGWKDDIKSTDAYLVIPELASPLLELWLRGRKALESCATP